jgi:hypothetical protein
VKFFMPQIATAQYPEVYEAIANSVKEQLRLKIEPKKIFRLEYVHDKHRLVAEVGMPDPQEGRYEVFAIFEAKPFIVFTRKNDGGDGLTMLVANDEITNVEYFD